MNEKNPLRPVLADLYKRWTLHMLYPSRYQKLIKEKPVKGNKIVFLEVRMKKLTDSFIPVYLALKKSGKWKIRCIFLQQDMADRKTVRARSLKALNDLADAKYIFINDSCNLIGSLPLREETEVIQLWHACGAFKKFGYSLTGKKFGSQKEELDRFPLYRNFSWVTVSSPEIVWAYADAFSLPEDRILPLGIPRTDVFYHSTAMKRAKEKLSEKLPECFAGGRKRKVVLYAPTFRGRVATAVSPRLPDFAALRKQLPGDDWLFVCKHHPFVKRRPELPEDLNDFVRDLSEDMTIEELLMVSDVCISDYSSIVFEYSLFERPMVFYAPDLEDYDDWRGFYYPYEEMTPGPIVKTTQELGDYLLNLDERFDQDRIHEFRQFFMSSCDGKATKRILKLLEEDEENTDS